MSSELRHLGEIDRRKFLGLTGASAAALVFGLGPFTEEAIARPKFSDYPFKLGLASGDPEPGGVVIWTRLAPRPLAADGRGGMPSKKVPVRWEVATDEAFKNVVQKGTTFARPELGHSVHVEVVGLRPGREYFYRFESGKEESPVGRTKTTPAFGAAVAQMSFAFASCQQYEHGYYTAYRRMSEEDLDLVFHLGDYIYEYGPNEYVAPEGNVRQHDGPEIITLADYRNRQAQYKSDKDLQAAHAAFAWSVTWDDHEVENNYADEIPEEGSETPGTAAFLRRRAAAYQAYYEHMPLRRTSIPRGPDMLLYRRLAYGNLAEFNVMDTRQYRDDQANSDEFNSSPSAVTRDPRRTLTGDAQERWLLRNLSHSDATWNVLAQQIFFAQIDFDTSERVGINPDAWDGYSAQRNRFADFFATRRDLNPVVITGDVHQNWANDILNNFNNPDSKVVGTEFVGTSITSGGDGSDRTPDTAGILAENPHIKFNNNQRGYVRCTLTPNEWRADYRVLPYVQERGAPVRTRASFVVEAGNPGLQPSGGAPAPRGRDFSTFSETDAERVRAQKRAGQNR